MKKILCLILICCTYLYGCNPVKQDNNTAIQKESEEATSNEIQPTIEPSIDGNDIIKQVQEYMETKYERINFYSLERFYFSNSTIPYTVYYVGPVDDCPGEYILAKLNLKEGEFPEEYYDKYTIYEPFLLDDNKQIAPSSITTFSGKDYFDRVINDHTHLELGDGTFTIGEPYEPTFEDFEGKETILNQIISVARERYFSNNPDNEPVFSETTKAMEVYIMDFDEGWVKFNEYRICVYTEDEYVYNVYLWYSDEENKFICDEGSSTHIRSYRISDLENSNDPFMKGEAALFERMKKYSVCKITG